MNTLPPQVPGFCDFRIHGVVPVLGGARVVLPPAGNWATQGRTADGCTGGDELAYRRLTHASVPPFKKNCDT